MLWSVSTGGRKFVEMNIRSSVMSNFDEIYCNEIIPSILKKETMNSVVPYKMFNNKISNKGFLFLTCFMLIFAYHGITYFGRILRASSTSVLT